MKAEQAKKMIDDGLTRLAAALEAGRSEALTEYLAVMARFHRYSFGNVLLILGQRPDATRVAGFQTWKSVGRYVKRGERGIVILAPMLLRRRETEETGQRDGDAERTVLRFKAVHVFDVSQTEGEPLPEPAKPDGDPAGHAERLRSFVASLNVELRYGEAGMSACGYSTGGVIVLRPGLPPAEDFAVLVHELAHELLHQGDGTERGTHSRRETEAEAVAFVVSEAIGLQTGTASSDYIQFHHGDRDLLAASLERVQKTAARILDAITAEETLPLAANG